MGPKRARKRQHFFLYLACYMIFVFLIQGCLYLPKQWQGEQQLAKARQLFAGGNYEAALEKNQKVLEQYQTRHADQALFQIGQIYAFPENPNLDYQKSLESFQRIIFKFPASRFREDAKIWALIIRQIIDQEKQIQLLKEKNVPLEKTVKKQKSKIKQLQDQLEKLKRIDIKIEEKKREAMPQTGEKGNGKDSGS